MAGARIINTKVHGLIDYASAVFLISSPFLFHFPSSSLEGWIALGAGGMTILMSLLTDYEFGLFRLLKMKFHLLIDMLLGITLISVPWILQISVEALWPFLLVGVLGIVVPLLTRNKDV